MLLTRMVLWKEFIKLKQQELTPVYIEYVKAQAWDGKLPTTMAGSSGSFINIK